MVLKAFLGRQRVFALTQTIFGKSWEGGDTLLSLLLYSKWNIKDDGEKQLKNKENTIK